MRPIFVICVKIGVTHIFFWKKETNGIFFGSVWQLFSSLTHIHYGIYMKILC